jgi:hypothetical protein
VLLNRIPSQRNRGANRQLARTDIDNAPPSVLALCPT